MGLGSDKRAGGKGCLFWHWITRAVSSNFFNLHSFIHDLKYPTVTYFVHLATLARDSSKKHLHTNQRNLIFMLLVRHVLQTFNLNGDCTLFQVSFGPGTSTVLEDWGSKNFLSDTESCCCRGPRHNLRGISNHFSKKKCICTWFVFHVATAPFRRKAWNIYFD